MENFFSSYKEMAFRSLAKFLSRSTRYSGSETCQIIYNCFLGFFLFFTVAALDFFFQVSDQIRSN